MHDFLRALCSLQKKISGCEFHQLVRSPRYQGLLLNNEKNLGPIGKVHTVNSFPRSLNAIQDDVRAKK